MTEGLTPKQPNDEPQPDKKDPIGFRYRSDSMYIADARNVECVCVPDNENEEATIVFRSGARVGVPNEEGHLLLTTLIEHGWKRTLPIE